MGVSQHGAISSLNVKQHFLVHRMIVSWIYHPLKQHLHRMGVSSREWFTQDLHQLVGLIPFIHYIYTYILTYAQCMCTSIYLCIYIYLSN